MGARRNLDAARQTGLVGFALLLALTVARGASGQAEPDLNALALGWAAGEYVSPILCQVDGEPIRALRRLRVLPLPRRSERLVAELSFSDLEAEQASRCFNALGDEERNLVGVLKIRLAGRSRPMTARRDFRAQLKRARGFTFDVASGALVIATVGETAAETRRVDFRGGRLELRLAQRGSDAARRLADLPGPRKVVFVLESRDGTRIELPAVLSRGR